MARGQQTGVGELKVIGSDASINFGNYRHANDLGTLSVVLDDDAFSTINVSGVVDLAGMFELELATELPAGEHNWTIINKTSDGGINGTFADSEFTVQSPLGVDHDFLLNYTGGDGDYVF